MKKTTILLILAGLYALHVMAGLIPPNDCAGSSYTLGRTLVRNCLTN